MTPDALPPHQGAISLEAWNAAAARRSAMARDGYLIMPQLLPPAEVARLREGLLEHFSRRWNWEGLGKHQPHASSHVPAIGWIFAHPAILQVFRDITGSNRPVFTGNCDAHMNMLSWWHKDTGESQGGCFAGDYYASRNIPVFRAGIYLQDHDEDGHGLHVRPGSHHTRSPMEGSEETLRTRAGDVVFFDIRLSHAGQFADPFESLLLRAQRRLDAPRQCYGVKETWRRLRGKQPKLSLFFTYGAPVAATDQFCAYEMASRRRSGAPEAMGLGAELRSLLAARDVAYNPGLMGR
jgi:hypothetical protein